LRSVSVSSAIGAFTHFHPRVAISSRVLRAAI
jgi:hypothetical protein